MARPHDTRPLPTHPAIGTEIKMINKYGEVTSPCASLTCPECRETRWLPLHVLRQYFKRGSRFTGHCRSCKSPQIKAGHSMWLTKNGLGRHVTSKGYIEISMHLIDKADQPIFLAMCPPSRKCVLEHRWVMAKILDRPLTRWEYVDHIDGNKQNNEPSNLRLYRTGNGDPGDMPGHGTYYHEWQMAEARIRALESAILQRGSRLPTSVLSAIDMPKRL